MKVQKVSFALIGMLLLVGKLPAQQVRTRYDHSANFAQYKSYSWKQANIQDPNLDRIKSPIDTALAAKGWTQVASGGDVSIMAIEITSMQDMHVSYEGITGGSGWMPGTGKAGNTDTYTVGMLVVELFDAKMKQPLWRGSVSDTFSNDPSKNMKNLDKGVQKMFENFPPRPSKK
jgi:hypothetical protein